MKCQDDSLRDLNSEPN